MTDTQTTRSTLTLWGGIAAIVGLVLWVLGATVTVPFITAFGFVVFVVGLICLITGRIRDRRR